MSLIARFFHRAPATTSWSCGGPLAVRSADRHPRSRAYLAATTTRDLDNDEPRPKQKLDKLVADYCQRQETRSSLQMLMETGRGEFYGPNRTEAFMGRMGQRLALQRILGNMACFLRKELPIRLAKRIRDLEQVPVLNEMTTIQQVKGIYLDSFQELVNHPVLLEPADEERFATVLEKLYQNHSSVLVQIAKGAYELRQSIIAEHGGGTGGGTGGADNNSSNNNNHDTTSNNIDPDEFYFHQMDDVQKFLQRFYMSRIGIRVLAGQYLALRERPRENYIGMIHLETSPSEIVQRAARQVQAICRAKYQRTPRVEVSGRLDLTFPYIPTYLHYILLELLKNALRATAEHHSTAVKLPPVSVIIADGMENEDVVIKIADQGGGIPRSRMKKVWSYLFTTADASLQQAMFAGQDHDSNKNVSPMAGLGYGLPISRSYVRYFGGDIDVMSMEGHGTDVFVFLKRLGDSKEPISV